MMANNDSFTTKTLICFKNILLLEILIYLPPNYVEKNILINTCHIAETLICPRKLMMKKLTWWELNINSNMSKKKNSWKLCIRFLWFKKKSVSWWVVQWQKLVFVWENRCCLKSMGYNLYDRKNYCGDEWQKLWFVSEK